MVIIPQEGMSERLVGNKKMLDSWKEELMKKERRCLEKVGVFMGVSMSMYGGHVQSL